MDPKTNIKLHSLDVEVIDFITLMSKKYFSFSIMYNEPHESCSTVEKWIDSGLEPDDFVSDEDKRLCIENNTIWTIRIYPRTHCGFIEISGYTLENCLAWVKENEKQF